MAIDTSNSLGILELIREVIKKHLESVIDKQYTELREEFLKRIEREKAVEIAGITLNIMKSIDLQTLNDRLVITLNKNKQESP